MVRGTVIDRASPSGEPGLVRTVWYSTLPQAVPGDAVVPAADGSFGFSFPTSGFPAGAIPSFRVDPGNGRVTASWEDVPLSALTLAPRVTGEYRQLRVEWVRLPGSDESGLEYELWKSTQRDGPYQYLSTLRTATFVDTAVTDGQWYYCRVVLEGVWSAANGARTCPVNEAFDVVLAGQLAYVADGTAGLRVVDIAGRYAYAASFESGVAVIDLLAP